MDKKRAVFIVGGILLVIIIVLTVLAVIDSNNKPEDYTILPLEEKIVNFENIVGKREKIYEEVSEVEIGEKKDGEEAHTVMKHSYKYKSKDGGKDAEIYVNILGRNGFDPFTDYDFSKEEATYIFIKQINETHYMLLSSIYTKETVELVFWTDEGVISAAISDVLMEDFFNELEQGAEIVE